MFIKTTKIAATVITLAASGVHASPVTDTYSGLVILGDSLSDVGRLFGDTGQPPAPFINGQFSNGPVWAELVGNVVTGASLTLENYAYAGATAADGGDFIVDLPEQLAELTADVNNDAVSLGARPLGVVFIGGNDIGTVTEIAAGTAGAAILSGTPIDVAVNQAIASAALGAWAAADQVRASVAALGAIGIADIVLVNSTDVGSTPRVQALGDLASLIASAASGAFNDRLGQEFTTRPVGVKSVSLFDFASLTGGILLDPASAGFTNVSDACFIAPTGPVKATATAPAIPATPGSLCANPDEYAFWDPFHPTAAAHELIAQGFTASVGNNALLAPVPLPAGVFGLLAGVAALGAVGARRNRRAA